VNCADISNSSFVQFQIWDFPGDINFNDPKVGAEAIFKNCSALIFVLDAQVRFSLSLSLVFVSFLSSFLVKYEMINSLHDFIQ
jgi:Ras-related GTP-binding protein C/D